MSLKCYLENENFGLAFFNLKSALNRNACLYLERSQKKKANIDHPILTMDDKTIDKRKDGCASEVVTQRCEILLNEIISEIDTF